MPKVSVGLGLTVQLNEATREFARPSIEITEIDTEQDIDEQIEGAKRAVVKVWDVEGKLLFNKLAELVDTPRPELADVLAEKVIVLETELSRIRELVNRLLVNPVGSVNVKRNPQPRTT